MDIEERGRGRKENHAVGKKRLPRFSLIYRLKCIKINEKQRQERTIWRRKGQGNTMRVNLDRIQRYVHVHLHIDMCVIENSMMEFIIL